jgi:SAM-dependent methyltransferase
MNELVLPTKGDPGWIPPLPTPGVVPPIPMDLWPPSRHVYREALTKQSVQARYGTAAFWHQCLCEYAGLLRESDVLEIGFGPGRSARTLWDYVAGGDCGGSYSGLEVVKEMVDWHRAHITPLRPAAQFFHAKVGNPLYDDNDTLKHEQVRPENYSLPFHDESFDVVFLASVFTHMFTAGVANYLAEIKRVLRPGGHVLASCFLIDEGVIGRLDEGITEFKLYPSSWNPDLWIDNDACPEVCTAHTASNHQELYEAAGLELVQFWLQGFWSRPPNHARTPGHGQDIVVARRPVR